jgi:hypothetical protein
LIKLRPFDCFVDDLGSLGCALVVGQWIERGILITGKDRPITVDLRQLLGEYPFPGINPQSLVLDTGVIDLSISGLYRFLIGYVQRIIGHNLKHYLTRVSVLETKFYVRITSQPFYNLSNVREIIITAD